MPASLESLEVIIQYKGSKYEKLASGALDRKSTTQLLLSDLGTLRANRPSLDNTKHVKGKFYLTWKSTGGHRDGFSLYNTWIKFAAMKEAIEALSIESITVNKVRARTRGGGQSAAPASSSEANTDLENNPGRDGERLLARADRDDVQYHNKECTSSPNKQDLAKCHEQNPSGYTPQILGNTEGLNQSSETSVLSSLDSLKNLVDSFKTPTEGIAANTLHQRPAVAFVQPANAIGSDFMSLKTPADVTKQHPSLPIIVEASPMKPQPVPSNDAKSRLMRDLWDTRREMATLQDREIDLIAALRRLDVLPHILETGSRHGTTDLEDRLLEVENALQGEKIKRLRAERSLNEIEKECRAPFVVPALLRAFLNISELEV